MPGRAALRNNGGAGILAIDSEVEVDGMLIEANGATGLVLDGTTRATLRNAAFDGHGGWGIDCLDAARLDLTDCRLAGNAGGGVRLGGSSTAVVNNCRFIGGTAGIEARASSSVEIHGGTVREAADAGIRISDSATCHIERTEVVECAGHGIELASARPAEVRFATIVRNGGDGVLATGTTIAVTNSIVALNEGAGLRISQDPAASSPPTFGYSTVWGNASGDYSLRLDSPCVGAGERGVTIGAHVDPTRASGSAIDVTIRHGDGLWGLDLTGTVRLASAAPFFKEA